MSSALEYRTVDKSTWPDGPWKQEPDKVQFTDAATGYPCLIVRGPVGALCGYVGVPDSHPWHGRHYSDVNAYAHGGLTFSDRCAHGDDPSRGICHIPQPGESDNVWWFGFDCAHYGDLCPACQTYGAEHYRDIQFVEQECADLAARIFAARSEP